MKGKSSGTQAPKKRGSGSKVVVGSSSAHRGHGTPKGKTPKNYGK